MEIAVNKNLDIGFLSKFRRPKVGPSSNSSWELVLWKSPERPRKSPKRRQSYTARTGTSLTPPWTTSQKARSKWKLWRQRLRILCAVGFVKNFLNPFLLCWPRYIDWASVVWEPRDACFVRSSLPPLCRSLCDLICIVSLHCITCISAMHDTFTCVFILYKLSFKMEVLEGLPSSKTK